MSRIYITVDDATLMDADPGSWSTTPPDVESLKLAASHQPWGLAVMATVAEAATLAMAGQPTGDTRIAITTRDNGWHMDVERH